MCCMCVNQLEDTLWAGLTDLNIKLPMGITAENLAEKYQITREDCDQYAYRTQQRWKAGECIDLTAALRRFTHTHTHLSLCCSS